LAAAVVSVLPVFGSALVWVPGTLVLFAQGSPGRALFLLVWGIAIVGTVDNLIRPLVLYARLSLHPLLLFGSVIGGIQAFGLAGIVLGPVILRVTAELLKIAREITLEARSDQLVSKLQV
jgi:predicted PurR-regulated permease PerM